MSIELKQTQSSGRAYSPARMSHASDAIKTGGGTGRAMGHEDEYHDAMIDMLELV
jgi:hypothetical protein